MRRILPVVIVLTFLTLPALASDTSSLTVLLARYAQEYLADAVMSADQCFPGDWCARKAQSGAGQWCPPDYTGQSGTFQGVLEWVDTGMSCVTEGNSALKPFRSSQTVHVVRALCMYCSECTDCSGDEEGGGPDSPGGCSFEWRYSCDNPIPPEFR